MKDETTIPQVEEKTLNQIKSKFQNFSKKQQIKVLLLLILLLIGLILIAVQYYDLGQEKEEHNNSGRSFDIDLNINNTTNESYCSINKKEETQWYRISKPDLKS